jgi:hypothetical protein
MEPVFMVLAESCAAAACLAIDNRQTVQQVDVAQLQQLLVQDPLMDGSTPEILVDDGDTTHTTITGTWNRQTSGGYGPGWLLAVPDGTPQKVQFRPEISAAGLYTLYVYVPVTDGAAPQTRYIIDNGNTREVTIATPTRVEGQTRGEWVSLGNYSLKKGSAFTVTVTTGKTPGSVTADALLCVPVKQ